MPEAPPLVFRMIPGSAIDTALTIAGTPERRNNEILETSDVIEVVSLRCPHCKDPIVISWAKIFAVNGRPMNIRCSTCSSPIRFEYGQIN